MKDQELLRFVEGKTATVQLWSQLRQLLEQQAKIQQEIADVQGKLEQLGERVVAHRGMPLRPCPQLVAGQPCGVLNKNARYNFWCLDHKATFVAKDKSDQSAKPKKPRKPKKRS